jgi:arsenical pump membrane protein
MALPFVLAVGIDWLVLRWWFRPAPGAEARARPAPSRKAPSRGPDDSPATGYALVVLALTLAGFALSSVLGIAPVWFAVGAAVLLAAPWLRAGGRRAVAEVARATEPRLLVAVIVLGLLVRAASPHGLDSAVAALLPGGTGLGDLLLVTLVSAALANLINNLPATLVLVPVAAGLGLGPVLCVLVGVNLGPNLTYGGSVATLLWRRIVHPDPVRVKLGEFTRLGALAAVPGLLLVPVAVWLSVRGFGPS